jgi:hypothetical protein
MSEITPGALLERIFADVVSDDPLGSLLTTARAVGERVKDGARESLQVERAACFTPKADLPPAPSETKPQGEVIEGEGERVDP